MTKATVLSVLACCLLSLSASAQTAVRASAPGGSPVAPIIPYSAAVDASVLLSPLSGLGLAPALSAPSIAAPSAVALPAALAVSAPAAARAEAIAIPVRAAAVAAPKPVAVRAAATNSSVARAQASALTALSAASVADEKPAELDALFDGATARAGDASVVAASAPSPRRSMLGRAALAAGIFIAHPAVALAAQAPSLVEPGAMALVTGYAPMATAIAAVLGALFGLWSSRSKDGSPANAGAVFSATLSHGAIAGAAAFALLDLTKVAFLGASATALAPLTAAVATAALAQSAFAAKFTDPATTPADRIIGAFPAVAMAFGLSVGAVAFLPAATMLSLGTAALMATGAATALYTAIFRLDKSPASGPSLMGRGFTLQALMTGLAVAIGATPYGMFFFALGMAGFATVLFAAGREVWTAVRSLLSPAPPATPPAEPPKKP